MGMHVLKDRLFALSTMNGYKYCSLLIINC